MSLVFRIDYAAVPQAFRDEACFTLDYSRDRFLHALHQHDDDTLWWRPHPAMNAAGNLTLHVCGNLRQWIVIGCAPSRPADDRKRPDEFAARSGFNVAELAQRLRDTVDEAKRIILSLNDAELLRPRFIQIADVTAIGAVWHSVAHLEGHAQELIYLTRLKLGDRYRFKDAY
jgi:hypothetical protein